MSHRERLLQLSSTIRHGNSLNSSYASRIKIELELIANELLHARDNETIDRLDLIIKHQKQIMDQNAAINTALDKLTGVVGEAVVELKAIAGTIQPGMTDDQVNAAVDRINQLATNLSGVESTPPAAQA